MACRPTSDASGRQGDSAARPLANLAILICGRPALIYQVPAMIVERPKIESTVRYLSVEIDDALDIAEKIEA